MVEYKDYYKILGIKKEASDAEIKDAYKKLAKKSHPDTEGGSEEKFKEVQEAYEVLKDSKKRAKYNKFDFNSQNQNYQQKKMYADFKTFTEFKNFEELKRNTNQQQKKSETFSDFFEMLFGQYQEKAGLKSKAEKPVKGEDYEMDIELSLEDAYHGAIRKIEITGGNKGVRRLEVTIPAGVRSGNRIKVPNEGKPGLNGAPNGDLYLKVKLKEHHVFKIEGEDDIHSEIELYPHEAVLGCPKKVPSLEGVIEIVIPPKTQNGKILRLKSKGLKNAKSKNTGDHYVHVIVKIPSEISQKEQDLYKQIQKLY